jgi:hypothetical protein
MIPAEHSISHKVFAGSTTLAAYGVAGEGRYGWHMKALRAAKTPKLGALAHSL